MPDYYLAGCKGVMLTPGTTVYLSGEFKCPAIGGFALTVKAEDYPVKVRILTNLKSVS